MSVLGLRVAAESYDAAIQHVEDQKVFYIVDKPRVITEPDPPHKRLGVYEIPVVGIEEREVQG